MESFGEYLKRERQLRNISLEEVSKVTRINKKLLQAIESDRFDLLPDKAFVKGFLRAYCRIVGLDPEEVILRFESSLETKPVVPPPEAGPRVTYSPRLTYIVPLVFIVILGGLSLLIHRKGERTHSTHTEGISQEEPLPADSAPLPMTSSRAPTAGTQKGSVGTGQVRQISVPGGEGLVLKVRANKETWIMVRADEGPPLEATLKADEEHVWRAMERLSLRVGNAGGVTLTLNDKPLEPLGPEGKVVGIVLTTP